MSISHILLVDDEKELLDVYLETLHEIKNTKMQIAGDGLEAYRKSRNQRFDLIITDFRMPRLDGVQLIRALRENGLNAQTPILLISGFPDEVISELKKEKLQDKVVILSKPVDPDFVLNFARNTLSMGTDNPPKEMTIDVQFINPFIASVIQVIRDMTGIQDIVGAKPYLLDKEKTPKVDISATIAVMSEHFNGNLALGFPLNTFLKISEIVLGEGSDKISDQNRDLVGELSNIIYGQTKKAWGSMGLSFYKAIPSVIDGSNHAINSQQEMPTILVPFSSSLGDFFAIIGLQKK